MLSQTVGGMKRSLWLILLTLPLLLNLSCQTNELKAYDRLQVGMEKGEVIAIMGSPRRTDRSNSKDRWTYIFYQGDQKYQKEVQFLEGKATYVGEVILPQISAEEQDRLNEASNNELQASWLAKKELLKNKLGDSNESAPKKSNLLYAPIFKPVE